MRGCGDWLIVRHSRVFGLVALLGEPRLDPHRFDLRLGKRDLGAALLAADLLVDARAGGDLLDEASSPELRGGGTALLPGNVGLELRLRELLARDLVLLEPLHERAVNPLDDAEALERGVEVGEASTTDRLLREHEVARGLDEPTADFGDSVSRDDRRGLAALESRVHDALSYPLRYNRATSPRAYSRTDHYSLLVLREAPPPGDAHLLQVREHGPELPDGDDRPRRAVADPHDSLLAETWLDDRVRTREALGENRLGRTHSRRKGQNP